jgi:hypothetical protein
MISDEQTQLTIERIKIKILIDASTEHVWHVLTNDKDIHAWCSMLSPVSLIRSDWTEGSNVYYLDQYQSGVIGKIVKRTSDSLVIEYIGVADLSYEDYTSDNALALKGKGETYRIVKKNGQTELSIAADVDRKNATALTARWTAALEVIKQLSETHQQKELKKEEQ